MKFIANDPFVQSDGFMYAVQLCAYTFPHKYYWTNIITSQLHVLASNYKIVRMSRGKFQYHLKFDLVKASFWVDINKMKTIILFLPFYINICARAFVYKCSLF